MCCDSGSAVIDPAYHTPPETENPPMPLPTPPPSDISSKSVIDRVLELLENHETARTRWPSYRVKINHNDYKILLGKVDERSSLKEYLEDKLRYAYPAAPESFQTNYYRLDYSSESGLLEWRMPTTLHDCFSQNLIKRIGAQLDHIGKGGGPIAEFARRIRSLGSGRIDLQEFDSDNKSEKNVPCIRKEPDGQFQHDEAQYPGLVAEIARWQDGRNLADKAWDYIQYSNANIQYVLVIDLPRGKKEEATVSLWQPRYTRIPDDHREILDAEEVVQRQIFRASDGTQPTPSTTIKLALRSFATAIAPAGSEDVYVTITYAELAELLGEAEKFERLRNPDLGGGMKSKRVTLKRKRPSPSPDRSTPETESNLFAERKAELEDEDFRGPTHPLNIPARDNSKRRRA